VKMASLLLVMRERERERECGHLINYGYICFSGVVWALVRLGNRF
jgi:hypothetical protein